jgi:putative sterol carrier protein
MSDGDFRSAAEFREVMDKVFTIMSTDSDMGPKLRDAQTPQRFEFPDVDLAVNITYAETVEDGQNLRWEWSDDVDWEPEVEMTMDSDIANRYFQGKENIAMAIARRKIKAGGDVKAALALIPITKPVYERYRALVEAEYPHLVV